MPDFRPQFDHLPDDDIRGSWTDKCSEECCCSEIHTSKFPRRCGLTGVWYHIFNSEADD